jgi:hypothetical protein
MRQTGEQKNCAPAPLSVRLSLWQNVSPPLEIREKTMKKPAGVDKVPVIGSGLIIIGVQTRRP